MKQRKHGSLRYRLLLFGFLVAMAFNQKAHAQFYSVKTDAVGLATGAFNLEAGMTLSYKWSVHLPVYYNPWTFSSNKKIKNLTFLPGVRYWQKETYGQGFFFGANAIISRYNFSGLLGSDYRYDGMGYGIGLSAGYSIPIRKRWNIEFELGGGAIMGKRDKYPCIRCGEKIKEESGVWFIPDKLAVSIVIYFERLFYNEQE